MSQIGDYRKTQVSWNRCIKAFSVLLNKPIATTTKQYIDSRLDPDIQIEMEAGYFPEDHNLDELLSVVPEQDLKAVKLVYENIYTGIKCSQFGQHNLVMPFRDVHGNVIALIGRTIVDDSSVKKYRYNSGCRRDLYVYGLDKAKDEIIQKNFVIGVEGQFDCCSLRAAGIRNVVAFGSASISKYQFFQIHRYTNNVVLMFDNDEAGKKGKHRAKERFGKHANIKLISPPKDFKDIDEFFRNTNDTKHRSYVIERIRNLVAEF